MNLGSQSFSADGHVVSLPAQVRVVDATENSIMACPGSTRTPQGVTVLSKQVGASQQVVHTVQQWSYHLYALDTCLKATH